MRFDVITLFPELFEPFLASGVTRRAYATGQVQVRLWSLRDHAEGNYRRVDDRPFGGGPGMVMMAEPLARCLAAIRADRAEAQAAPLVLFSPIGRRLDHAAVQDWSAGAGAVLLCGRYEGVDQRFIDAHVDMQISLGDFVLSGGEIAAMALLDAQAGMGRAPRIQILATDLDTQVLLQAREAVYPLAALDKLPTGYASRYFETLPDGKQVRVKPALRQIVSFRRLNLIDPQSGWGISERMDAVFCRNVMIYFDRQTQLDVLAKFPPVLREDGVLFVGHSENFYQANPRLKLRGKTVYEVVTPGQAAPAVSPRRI